MPTEQAPTSQSSTTLSVGNSSEDRNSERSDSIATVEIVRSDGDPEPPTRTPSENAEVTENENVSRHRTPNGGEGCQKFASSDDLPELPLERKKSNGISKGVILNAMNFGTYDLRYNQKEFKEIPVVRKDQELCENGVLAPKGMEASSEINLKAVEDEKGGEGKKEMSLPRKIAFGFSFLPSVMFILTFAVIMPCKEYTYPGHCEKNKWSLLLNYTEISAYINLPETLLLGYQFTNSTGSFEGVMSLDDETGKVIWKLPLDSLPKSFECLKVDVNEDGFEDCLTILQNGNVCAFNLSDGFEFWTFRSNEPKDAAVFLTGCPRYNGFKLIAVASYSKENTLGIDVLRSTDGFVLASKQIKLEDRCSTFNMKSWKHDSEMDLLFYCENVQNLGHISRVRQSLWCPPGEEQSTIIPEQPLWRFEEGETQVIYLPTSEGILIWTGALRVTFIESDGAVKWTDSLPYVPQNRIAKYGNFYKGGEQLALIGQNASSDIVVSVLTSENGKELITLSVPDRTLNQALVLRGNETDALLLSVLKVTVTETELPSDNEVILLSNASVSSDFRTDVPYQMNGKRSIMQELVLFQFEGKNTTHFILESEIPVSCNNEGVCESEYQAIHIISAVFEETKDSMNLKIVTLKTPDNDLKLNGSQQFSQLTALDVKHHDNPVSGETSCTL